VAQCDAEALPFPSGSFDCVTIGSAQKTRKRGHGGDGKVAPPRWPSVSWSSSRSQLLQPLYDLYSFQVLPRLGKLIVDDEASYRYLAESIRMHPGQEELKSMMEAAGFDKVDYLSLAGGVVAIHRGFRY
jgi:demethylmenaquinone methyltransferase/2-methoxy-6-polyprenyl-1,4-benzoquinol methylase